MSQWPAWGMTTSVTFVSSIPHNDHLVGAEGLLAPDRVDRA